MKSRLSILVLFILSAIVVIPAMAQEDNCVKMDIEIESTKNLEWETCYLEEYASLLIKTSSEEPTDNKIILQKDTFWNYDVDCSPTRFFTLINGEENFRQEKYFGDYRILFISLEKGENEIEIIIATIPGMSANEYCLTKPKPMLDSPRIQIDNNIKPFDVTCNAGLTQVFKIINGFTVCVFPNSVEELIERGWATYYATRAYDDDGKIVGSSPEYWAQIIKFEMQRQNIEYEEPTGFENYRTTDEQPLTPFKICITLIGEDGNRFYPNFIVTEYDPIITKKVVFSKIHPDDCKKEFYSLG